MDKCPRNYLNKLSLSYILARSIEVYIINCLPSTTRGEQIQHGMTTTIDPLVSNKHFRIFFKLCKLVFLYKTKLKKGINLYYHTTTFLKTRFVNVALGRFVSQLLNFVQDLTNKNVWRLNYRAHSTFTMAKSIWISM